LSLTASGGSSTSEQGLSVGMFNESASAITGSLFVWGTANSQIITGTLA
jgi:hypothetical protein